MRTPLPLLGDEKGKGYPWEQKSIEELLGPILIRNPPPLGNTGGSTRQAEQAAVTTPT